MLIEREVLRFNGFKWGFNALRDVVAVEEIMKLHVNGRFFATLHCSPCKVEELAVGLLLTEGLIEDVKDLLEVRVSEKSIYVRLSTESPPSLTEKPILAAAFCEEALPQRTLRILQRLKSTDLKFSAEVIFKTVEILDSKATVFRASGGTHAAALINESGEVIAFAEDIGRHNAVDKVIGEAAIKGADFIRLILALTGRLSSEIVVKAAQVGVPVIVSLSAPTSMGIKIAENLGLTLIGFARGRRFNIYTLPSRIRELAT